MQKSLSLLLLLPFLLRAAPTNTVRAVTVTAAPVTFTEGVSSDGAQSATVTRAELDRLNARDLQSALRQIPGVAISRYAPVGSYGGAQGGSVYVRGAGAARPGGELRVYADGAPRESGVWAHPLMDSAPVDFAETISLHKNPHSARHPGAFAAVDVETFRQREPGCSGRAELAYGRFNTILSSAVFGAKDDATQTDAAGGAAYKYSQGAREHNTAEIRNAFARAGIDLSPHERIDFIYTRTESRAEDPGEIRRPPPVFNRFDLSTDLFTLKFTEKRDAIAGHSLVYFEHGDVKWRKDHLIDGAPMSPAGSADTAWLDFGWRNFWEIAPTEQLTLTAAFDFAAEGGHTASRRFTDGRRVSGFDARFLSLSPYLAARYAFRLDDDWTLTPSLGSRWHWHEVYRSEAAPDAALTLAWREDAALFVSASRAAHYPGVYVRAMAEDFARRSLRAEIMDYCAAGAKFKAGESLEALLTVYRARISDRIDRTAAGYVNSGGMKSTGAELSARQTVSDAIALYGGVAFARPDRSPASRLPEWMFTLGEEWKICDWLKWSVDAQYTGAMYAYSTRASAEAANLRKVGDALVFNTRVAVVLNEFLPLEGEIFFALENFTNRHYEYYPGYPMPGAMGYTGIKLEF